MTSKLSTGQVIEVSKAFEELYMKAGLINPRDGYEFGPNGVSSYVIGENDITAAKKMTEVVGFEVTPSNLRSVRLPMCGQVRAHKDTANNGRLDALEKRVAAAEELLEQVKLTLELNKLLKPERK